jgi:hypothetical protein
MSSHDYVWKVILEEVGDYDLYFLDLEVYPEITKGAWTNEHKIIAAGVCNIETEPVVFVGDELQVLRSLNTYFFRNKPLIIAGYGIGWLDIPLLVYKVRTYFSEKVQFRTLLESIERAFILDLVHPTSEYMKLRTGQKKLWKLVDVAHELELPKLEFSSDIYRDQEKLVEYLKRDILTLKALFKRLKDEYFAYIS